MAGEGLTDTNVWLYSLPVLMPHTITFSFREGTGSLGSGRESFQHHYSVVCTLQSWSRIWSCSLRNEMSTLLQKFMHRLYLFKNHPLHEYFSSRRTKEQFEFREQRISVSALVYYHSFIIRIWCKTQKVRKSPKPVFDRCHLIQVPSDTNMVRFQLCCLPTKPEKSGFWNT